MKSENTLTEIFDYNLDLRTRTIFLTKYGGEDSDNDGAIAEKFLKGFHILETMPGDKPITVKMNHDGGDENCNMAIYDVIKASKAETTVIVQGNAASMGAWVLQAADRRIMMPSSRLMIHIGSTSAPDDHARNNIKLLKALERELPRFEEILLSKIREKHPKFRKDKLVKMLDFNTYLWPEDAVELGLADQIGLD